MAAAKHLSHTEVQISFRYIIFCMEMHANTA